MNIQEEMILNNNFLFCDVIINDFLCCRSEKMQFRFPRSKKIRIRNKWRKQPQNFKTIENHYTYKIDNQIIVSTKIYNQFKANGIIKNF